MKVPQKKKPFKPNKRAYEHFEHQRDVSGVGAHKNKKKYNRKIKHKKKF